MKKLFFPLIINLLTYQIIFAQVKTQSNNSINFVIDTNKVLINNFIGFGAEWDPYFWASYNIQKGVVSSDWELVQQRIKWMHLPFVRMMILMRGLTKGDGVFNWESDQMKNMYRQLDFCQENNITVFLTEWGIGYNWDKAPGIIANDDPKYAEAIGNYLDYLLLKKGYTCIKYFIFVNEPNLEPGGWDKWKKGIINVKNIIDEKKLPIKLAGSDESDNFQWQADASKQLANDFDVWDIHEYKKQKLIETGNFQDTLRHYWQIVRSNDANVGNKFFMLGEIGVKDGLKGANVNDSANTYWYGLNIADMAVQAVLAGTSAVSAWMLEDGSHNNFNNGMWKDKSGNFQLKPWYYSWSLLSKFFPAGTQIIQAQSSNDSLRCLIGKYEGNWSICIINQSNQDKNVNLESNFLKQNMIYYNYSYNKDFIKTDYNQFMLPIEKIPVTHQNSISFLVKPKSLVVLTTLD